VDYLDLFNYLLGALYKYDLRQLENMTPALQRSDMYNRAFELYIVGSGSESGIRSG
jgi:hypothetical protein